MLVNLRCCALKHHLKVPSGEIQPNGAILTLIGRELQNGWNVSVATKEIENEDGSRFEGIGIPPDLVIQ